MIHLIQLDFDKTKHQELMDKNHTLYKSRLKKELHNHLYISIVLVYISYVMYDLRFIGVFMIYLSVVLIGYTIHKIIKGFTDYKTKLSGWKVMEQIMDFRNKAFVDAKYELCDDSIKYVEDGKIILETKWTELDSFQADEDQVYVFYDKEDPTKFFWIPKIMTRNRSDFEFLCETLNRKIQNAR